MAMPLAGRSFHLFFTNGMFCAKQSVQDGGLC